MEGDDDELVALELEALEATYGGGGGCFGENGADGASASTSSPPFFSILARAPHPTITARLTPRGVGKGAAYVEATLTLTAPPGYPSCAQPVAVSLSAVRGLGDARRAALAAGLAAEAASLVGDAALGTLIEAGLDGLTALNAPEGDCALCLGPLLGGGGSVGAVAALSGAPAQPPKDLLKLECYHVLHL